MKTSSACIGTLLTIVALGSATTVNAQQPPPPAAGMAAVEGTMKSFYKATNTVIVATLDGVEHVYHFTKDLIVHGGKGTGVDALAGLNQGSTVVVHYSTRTGGESADEIDRIGGAGLKATEGIVTRIDRRRRQITIRYDSGKTETLGLTDRAAEETSDDVASGAGANARVVVYYSDESGQRVVHYFRKVK